MLLEKIVITVSNIVACPLECPFAKFQHKGKRTRTGLFGRAGVMQQAVVVEAEDGQYNTMEV